MQIQTTGKYHFPATRMVIIRKTDNDKCWRGYGATTTIAHGWWGCKVVETVWKTIWQFLNTFNT